MPNSNSSIKKRSFLLFFLVFLFIGIDYGLKQWALSSLQYGEPMSVVPGLLNWTLVYNFGAAFSFLGNHSGWQRYLFVGIAVCASIYLSYLIIKAKPTQKLIPFAFALILAGAIGNLIDRIQYGYVIDYIHFYYGDWSFAIFNFADICVCVGAGLAVLSSFLERDRSI